MFTALLQLVRRPPVPVAPVSSTLRGDVCPPTLALETRLFAHLPQVKGEFCAELDDLRSQQAGFLMARIGAAGSMRELWHLRSDLYSAVARHHSQDEAERRLARLNRHFPTRSPRSGFLPLS